jgi:hypothetical protein
VPEGDPVYPTEISIAHIAQAMLVFNKDLIKRLPLSWIRKNLVERYRRKLRVQISRTRNQI